MGSSALRAMSLGKPLVVQGEHGFWAPADETTFDTFVNQGWYGVGTGTDSVRSCMDALRPLLVASPEELEHRGARGRKLVCDRYSLRAAASQLVSIYTDSSTRRPSATLRLWESAKLTKNVAQDRTVMAYRSVRDARTRDDTMRTARPSESPALVQPDADGDFASSHP